MSLKKTRNEKAIVMLTAIVVFFICIRNITKLNLPYIADDEFGYWSTGAFFAGYDWSGVTQHISFYSYGYGIFLAPLIRILDNPKILYRAAIGFNGVFVSLAFILAYTVGKMLWNSLDKKWIYVISLLVILYPSNLYQCNIAWSETFIMFCFWLSVFLMVSAIQTGRPLYYLMWEMIVIYMYAVHNRTLPVLIMYIFVMFMLYKAGKINKTHFFRYFFIAAAGFFVCSILKEYLISKLWLNSKIVMGNSYSGVLKSLFSLTDGWENWRILLENIAGRIFYLGISTYMFAFMSLFWIIKFWKKQFAKENWEVIHYVSVFCFFVVILETILGSVMALRSSTASINNLIYGRYVEPFVGPFLLLGMCLCQINALRSRKTIIIYAFLSVVEVILGFITNSVIADRGLNFMGAMNNIGMILYYSDGRLDITRALIVAIIIGCLFIPCFGKHMEKIAKSVAVIVMIVFSIASAGVGSRSVLEYHAQHQYMYDVAELVKTKVNTNMECDIYYLMDGFYNNRKKNLLQYMLKDQKIRCINNPAKINTKKDHVIVTTEGNKYIFKLLFDGYDQAGHLDEAVILYFNAEQKNVPLSLSLKEELNTNDLKLCQGITATLPDTVIAPGTYTIKSAFEIEKNKPFDTEVGFVMYSINGKEIGRNNIWDILEKGGKEFEFEFNLDRESRFSVLVYSYDNVTIQVDDMELTKIDKKQK